MCMCVCVCLGGVGVLIQNLIIYPLSCLYMMV